MSSMEEHCSAPFCLLAEMSPEQGLVSGGAQLQLSPLQPFHQGQYTCLAQGPGGETRKEFMVLVRGRASPSSLVPVGSASEVSLPPAPLPQPPSLLGAVPPQISSTEHPSEHSVLEGSRVRLECRAEGQPTPHISWLKDGQPLGLQPPSNAR